MSATRPGDWTCAHCDFSNFASRKTCKDCNRPRPRPGDWKCPACKEINFSSRFECHLCGTAKPGGVTSSASSSSKTRPGDWTCALCGELNFGSRVACRRCAAVRIAAGATCCICVEKPPGVCLKTCGHLGMCIGCADKVTMCPICRKPFEKTDITVVYSV